jgi:hypothetical protein
MMISRRPNKRQSTDRAPGPRKATAAPMITTRIAGSREVNKFGGGAGSQESAMPVVVSATNPPATGVRNPISNEIPLTTTASPMTQTSTAGFLPSARYAAPWITAVAPTATRNSSNPTPGHPLGNVEYNRCRLVSLVQGACVRTHLTQINGYRSKTNP